MKEAISQASSPSRYMGKDCHRHIPYACTMDKIVICHTKTKGKIAPNFPHKIKLRQIYPIVHTREDSIHRHHQMVNTEIRLIISFAAKDRESLYSQQKQDQALTVAQIMNSLLANSDLN